MPPAVVNAINDHRAALLAREQAAMQTQARAWLQVEQAIQAQTDALALELARTPGMATMGQLARSRRYQALMEQTRDELAKYSDYMEQRIVSGQRDMVTLALQHSAQAVQSVATEAQITVPFNRLPVSAVNNMVGLAGDGSPLHAILADASRVGPDALGQQLVSGIALGRNPVTVARQAIRLGLGQSFTRMQTIARTEQLRVYRETTLQSYANSRVVVGYKRLSARDDRVCPACLMADGQMYPIEHGFDEHPNGRCALIPVLANVPPVQFQTGQQWFEQQPEATQRKILGAGRYDAWQSGKASLGDMVSRDYNDTWGGSLRATRVRDLLAGRGGGVLGMIAPNVPPAVPPAPVSQIVTAEQARGRVIEATAEHQRQIAAVQSEMDKIKIDSVQHRQQIEDLYRQMTVIEKSYRALETNPATADMWAEMKALQAKELDANRRLGQLVQEQKRIRAAAAQAGREHLYVDNPASIAIDASKRNAPEVLQKWQNSADAFNRLVDSKVVNGSEIKIKPIKGRANYNPFEKVVKVSAAGDDERVLLHEFGHWLEDANPTVHEKILEFYDKRTKGEKLRRMEGYGPKEKTRRDKFINDYMGKEYVYQGTRYATEILSMGLEYFYADPMVLAAQDPEYFDFIFHLVRGQW